MTCDHYRELISARLDGELDAAEDATLDHHLETCDACRTYHDDAWDLRRALRLVPVDTGDAGVTANSLAARGIGGRPRAAGILRAALFVIGGTLVLFSVQAIVAPDQAIDAHLSRHDGVFDAALGAGMLAVAAKPYRAIGLVPLTSVLTLLMVVVAAADLIGGNASITGEAVHVVQFAGLVCLWVISGGVTRMRRRGGALRHRLPGRRATTVPTWPIARDQPM